MKLKVKVFLFLGLLIFLAGCARFTLTNYQRIEKGMAKEEVKEILGEPWVAAPKIYFYQGPGLRSATIFFNEEGKVVEKKWDEGIYQEYQPGVPGPGEKER